MILIICHPYHTGNILNILTVFHLTCYRYFPVFDLVNIYKDLYGEEKIDANVITSCSSLLYAEWIGEKLAGTKLFIFFASKSPFLVENLHSYFLGEFSIL